MTNQQSVRRLTDRQIAVLAAIERRGACTLLDLRSDFPELAPSAVLRSMSGLERRGAIRRFGRESQVYLGGVTFVPIVVGGETGAQQ